MNSPQVHTSPSSTMKLAAQPTPITLSRLSRWVGPLCMVTAGLIVLQQAVALLIIDPDSLALSVRTLPAFLNSLLLLSNFVLLLLCLTGLYLRQAERAGTLGPVAFLIAFLGTVLLAGDWWFEAFVIQFIAKGAPQLLNGAASGTLLRGAMTGFALFALGWLLFGIASYRARVFLRSASLLLALGGVIGFKAGFPPYQVPLALAIGWLGYRLRRSDSSPSEAPMTNLP